jgi:HlyD family secretion protein
MAAEVISRDQFEADAGSIESNRRGAARRLCGRGAEHELEIARARLQQPTAAGSAINVVSPIDGVVLKRYRESEADVPAGESLLEAGHPANLEIVSDLLSTDAVRVSPGSRVLIDLEAEIVAGLAEGEPVILHPPETLAEGMQVRTRVAEPAAPPAH